MPATSSGTHERSVKTPEISHIARQASSRARSGFEPSPNFAISPPPTMKPMLDRPNSRPHASTLISSRP